ncbi:tyrosine-type recombinase/integrase [Geminocystis sp. NIES-3709]|uniref:tyrosine-type recombinase/integrase n=1 Tax=Geminocystis sp. NIES-3709 TaxID=1617448 RepID=UPI0005FC859D|nr:tyrosine-type recombinase/integrase [Geminocystis sp. NIES-3709]BAQ66944.1 tyrosine recombinase XerC [Geminocystis sp. NIES-3709]
MTNLTIASQVGILPLSQPLDDVYSGLIASVHKKTTQSTYKQGIKHFCYYLLTGEVVKGIKVNLSEYQIKWVISDYLKLDAKTANAYLGSYRTAMIEAGYSSNSINVKIASVKALVRYAFDFEQCSFLLDKVKAVKAKVYRDTKGTTPDNINAMLSLPDTLTVKGKRDYAILRLLWDNGLRRSEVSNLNIEDFNPSNRTLRIMSKGKIDPEYVYLSNKTIEAVEAWLSVRYQPSNSSLFISLDNASNGHPLSDKSVYRLVKKYSSEIPSGKVLSPHQIRHSSITALLEATNGNVRLAQKFSRHSNLNTLMIYDDNRVALQQEAVNILSSLA